LYASLIVKPERVLTLGDLVEHGRVAGAVGQRSFEDVLVKPRRIRVHGTDLDRGVEQLGLGIDDQRPDLAPNVQDDGFGVGAGDRLWASLATSF